MKKEGIEKQKSVYVLLSKTSTVPSKVIKMWTREPYAHSSIALDENFDELYSFARRKIQNPFNAGFIKEDITTGIFGRDVDTECTVFKLDVTKEQYKNICEEIDKFKKNEDAYGYNYLGLFSLTVNKPLEREYNFFCSQFVYSILTKSGVELFKKKPGLVRPEDFRTWDGFEMIYKGKLTEYREFLKSNKTKELHAI